MRVRLRDLGAACSRGEGRVEYSGGRRGAAEVLPMIGELHSFWQKVAGRAKEGHGEDNLR